MVPPGPLFCINWCRVWFLVNETLVGPIPALTKQKREGLSLTQDLLTNQNVFKTRL
jgi:hypothetical protein